VRKRAEKINRKRVQTRESVRTVGGESMRAKEKGCERARASASARQGECMCERQRARKCVLTREAPHAELRLQDNLRMEQARERGRNERRDGEREGGKEVGRGGREGGR